MTDLIIVVAFLLIILIVGIRAGRGIKDIKEYVLANREFSTAALFLTYLATDIGGGSISGDVKEAFSNGIIMTAALSGFCISFLFRAFIIAPKMKYFRNCLTTGDVMSQLYSGPSKLLAGLLGIAYSIAILGTQLIVMGIFCQSMLGVSNAWGIVVGGITIVAYATLGGIKAVTTTDILQFLIVLVIIPMLAILAIQKAGGIENVLLHVPEGHFRILDHPDFYYYFSIFLLWGIFSAELAKPAVMQRMLIARNTKQLKNTFITMAAADLAFRLVIMLIALAGLILYPTINPESMIPHMLRDLMPSWLHGVAITGLLAVVMSTADSHLHAAGITLAHDIVQPIAYRRKKKIDELKWAKVGTLVIGCLTIVVVLYFSHLLRLNLAAMKLVVPLLAFPLISGILGLKPEKKGFYLATGVTCITFVAAKLLLPASYRYLTTLISILVNGIVFIGSHLWINRGFVTIQREEYSNISQIWQPDRRDIFQRIKWWIPTPKRVLNYSTDSINRYGASYVAFGTFCCINYILPYFMWGNVPPHLNDIAFAVRILGATLCGLFIVNEKWYKPLQSYLPVFWHFTVMYCIPFTSTIMFLFTGGSTEWLINVALCIFFLIALVDWVSVFVLGALGVALGFLVHYLLVGPVNLALDFSAGYLLVYQIIFGLLIGLIFARRRQQRQDQRAVATDLLQATSKAQGIALSETLKQQEATAIALPLETEELITSVWKKGKRMLQAENTSAETIESMENSWKHVIQHIKERSYEAIAYVKLEIDEKHLYPIKELLQQVHSTFTKTHEDPMVIETSYKTQHEAFQADLGKIRQLIGNGLAEIQEQYQHLETLQIGVEDTVLEYPVSIGDCEKKIPALRFTLTTQQELPALKPLYDGGVALASPDITKMTNVRQIENEHIVRAHYGVMHWESNDQGMTQTYVIPLQIRDVRPKLMDSKYLTPGAIDSQVDPEYWGMLCVEEQWLLDWAKATFPDQVDMVEEGIRLMKVAHRGQMRKSGEYFATHPIRVAWIMTQFNPKLDTVLAALLHDTVEDTPARLPFLAARFNDRIAYLVDKATHLDTVHRRVKLDGFSAMYQLVDVDDGDAWSIKIADRIHNLRTVKFHKDPAKRQKIAEDTLEWHVIAARRFRFDKQAEELEKMAQEVLGTEEAG